MGKAMRNEHTPPRDFGDLRTTGDLGDFRTSLGTAASIAGQGRLVTSGLAIYADEPKGRLRLRDLPRGLLLFNALAGLALVADVLERLVR